MKRANYRRLIELASLQVPKAASYLMDKTCKDTANEPKYRPNKYDLGQDLFDCFNNRYLDFFICSRNLDTTRAYRRKCPLILAESLTNADLDKCDDHLA